MASRSAATASSPARPARRNTSRGRLPRRKCRGPVAAQFVNRREAALRRGESRQVAESRGGRRRARTAGSIAVERSERISAHRASRSMTGNRAASPSSGLRGLGLGRPVLERRAQRPRGVPVRVRRRVLVRRGDQRVPRRSEVPGRERCMATSAALAGRRSWAGGGRPAVRRRGRWRAPGAATGGGATTGCPRRRPPRQARAGTRRVRRPARSAARRR